MRIYTLKELSRICSARIKGNENEVVEQIFFDSRSIYLPKNGIFFTFQGQQKNGELYIKEAYKKGIRNFVVSQVQEVLPNANYLIVESPLKALQQWAKYHRGQFNIPIISITGSNGKTIVKEWLNQLLWKKYNIARSPKSYNSQIGVPLSILQITPSNNLGIFEAGISKPNEMAQLAEIIEPNIGILTNIGTAHLENFSSKEELIKEKLNLFNHSKSIIYNKDDELLNNHLQSFKNKKQITFGKSEGATLQLLSKTTNNGKTRITIKHKSQTYNYKIPFLDEASVQNSLIVLTTIISLGLNLIDFLDDMQELLPVEMRLQIKEGIRDSIIINDAFNSDLVSVKIALDLLAQQPKERKSVVLTDILQSSLSKKQLYQSAAELINKYKIDELILIGKEIINYKNLFHTNVRTFESTYEFFKTLTIKNVNNEAILLKGARFFKLEKIAEFLEKQSHDTVLEINLQALIENLNVYRSKLKPNTKIMCMIKANSYGTGSVEIAQTLEYQKIDYLGVAYADEGVELRKAGIILPIMVMNPEQSSYSTIIDYKLEPEIYSFRVLNAFLKTLKEKSITKPYAIHLKINTGMNRLGFNPKEIKPLITQLLQEPSLKINSIFTHLATADMPQEKQFALKQLQLFDDVFEQIITALKIQPIKHAINSAGIEHFSKNQYNMVRLGIGLYGVSSDESIQKKLKNVIEFKTVISQINHINKGETVSYGRRFTANQPAKIATLPVGYADGINRALSNKVGSVNINGNLVPIVGTICMDMLMVDVTGIDCNEGDTAILFGKNPSIQNIAKQINTIPYEVLTSISSRVKRIYYIE